MELLIVGLDGLSFNMLDRFDVEFDLLSDIREAGAAGHLTSVDTPTTLPAWTSFATGQDPGSHGVSNMTVQHADYTSSPARTNLTTPAAYDFLENSLFVHLPASYGRVPAAEGTLLVSGMLATDKYDAVPEPLQALDAFDDYVLDHDTSLKYNPDRYLRHVREITRNRHAFAREAFETRDPRVGFLLFSTPDWAGHILSNVSRAEKKRRVYAGLLSTVADYAADLAGMADNVVLMSDHGFEHKRANVHVSDWLRDEGYLVEERGGFSAVDAAMGVAKAAASRSDRVYALFRRVYNQLMGTAFNAVVNEAARPDPDFAATTAWQLRYACVYLNDDRFETPTVDDPDALAEEIRAGLAGLEDDEGEPVFRDVLTAAEAYADPGEWAPDVVARPAPGVHPTTLFSPTGGCVSPTDNFEHRYRGIFAARGPLFAAETTVEGMSIVDVLPTVLAALGEPLSPDFDGEVRGDALATDADVAVLDPADVPEPRTRDAGRDDERETVVEGRLADLGYIE